MTPKFTGISLRKLNEKLGRPGVKRRSGGAHAMMWQCNGPQAPGCFAEARAEYRHTPPNLTPFEEELFDNTPTPEDGWTIRPCPKHRETFADHPE